MNQIGRSYKESTLFFANLISFQTANSFMISAKPKGLLLFYPKSNQNSTMNEKKKCKMIAL